MVAPGGDHTISGTDEVSRLRLPGSCVAQMYAKMRWIKVEIAVDLLEVHLMLMGRPTRPTPGSSPRQSGDQSGSRRVLIESHEDFTLVGGLPVDLVQSSERKRTITPPREKTPLSLVAGAAYVEEQVLAGSCSRLATGRKIE